MKYKTISSGVIYFFHLLKCGYLPRIKLKKQFDRATFNYHLNIFNSTFHVLSRGFCLKNRYMASLLVQLLGLAVQLAAGIRHVSLG